MEGGAMGQVLHGNAATPEQCWRALQDFAESLVGFRLFTVMTVDMPKLLACRAYTNNPIDYPVSGTKPITMDRWFDIVHRQQKMFVANTISEIAEVFPDHEKIWSLGCGSVVNLPVIIEDKLVATINLLHEEHYYTAARANLISSQLAEPSRFAYLRAIDLTPQ
jgi:hypothetical protein